MRWEEEEKKKKKKKEEEGRSLSQGEYNDPNAPVCPFLFFPSLFNLNPFKRLYWQDKIALTLPRLKCIAASFWLDEEEVQ